MKRYLDPFVPTRAFAALACALALACLAVGCASQPSAGEIRIENPPEVTGAELVYDGATDTASANVDAVWQINENIAATLNFNVSTAPGGVLVCIDGDANAAGFVFGDTRCFLCGGGDGCDPAALPASSTGPDGADAGDTASASGSNDRPFEAGGDPASSTASSDATGGGGEQVPADVDASDG